MTTPAPQPKTRQGGGRPYRSALLPHYAKIVELRAAYATWDEVAAALGELGVRITAVGVRSFVTRRLKGRRPVLLGPSDPADRPAPRPAVPSEKPGRAKFDSPTFVLGEAPGQPKPNPLAELFTPADDIRK